MGLREQICCFLPDLRPGPCAPRPGRRMSPTATSTPPDTRNLTGACAYTPARTRSAAPRGGGGGLTWAAAAAAALGGAAVGRCGASGQVPSDLAPSRPRPGGECPSGHVSGGEVRGSEGVSAWLPAPPPGYKSWGPEIQ